MVSVCSFGDKQYATTKNYPFGFLTASVVSFSLYLFVLCVASIITHFFPYVDSFSSSSGVEIIMNAEVRSLLDKSYSTINLENSLSRAALSVSTVSALT